MGPDRRQIDLLYGVEVLRAYEKMLDDEGWSVDADLEADLLNDKARRKFISSHLSFISGFKLRVTPGAPIKTLADSCGPMIRILSSEPAKHGGPGRYRYVASHPATPIELLAAYNTWIDLAERRARKAAEVSETFKAGLHDWPRGATTLRAAVAAENEARLSRKR